MDIVPYPELDDDYGIQFEQAPDASDSEDVR